MISRFVSLGYDGFCSGELGLSRLTKRRDTAEPRYPAESNGSTEMALTLGAKLGNALRARQ